MTEEQRKLVEDLRNLIAIMIIILSLYLAFTGNPSVPMWIDAGGFISHKVETSISSDLGWIDGEIKTCLSHPLDPDEALKAHKLPGYALMGVDCGSGKWRRMNIRFWGSERQPGKKAAFWDCTRTTDSFSCKQVDPPMETTGYSPK